MMRCKMQRRRVMYVDCTTTTPCVTLQFPCIKREESQDRVEKLKYTLGKKDGQRILLVVVTTHDIVHDT